MRFTTYNIRHGQGLDGMVSPARIARLLGETHSDLIGLNEVWRPLQWRDQATVLGGLLGMAHEYSEVHRRWPIGNGNAVLTRGRILECETLKLPSGFEQRGCLLATVELGGVTVRFASTHLSLARKARQQALEALAERLPQDLPLVLTGDFNTVGRELGALRRVLTVIECPASFPSWKPSRALDHVAFSSHWRLEGVRVERSFASDHLPIIADLELA